MNLEEKLLLTCKNKGITVGLAESCTGGALAARITSVSGASSYFLGGIVAYSNKAKIEILKVSQTKLEQFGAVSKETALEMLTGVQRILNPQLSISITGIAGPEGGTLETPVGLVYVAFGMRGGEQEVLKFQFTGNRLQIIQQAAEETLSHMINIANES